MKERIFLCLLLATVSLLCSCSEQRYVPDSISSHAEITAKPRTTQPEKSTTLPQSFSRNDVQMTTEPGDIVLYSGNQLVVFFSSNTWNYTKLGHINLAAEKLAGLLGGDSAVIEVKYE